MHLQPTTLLILSSAIPSTACTIQSGITTTFYGSPDNDPPGSDATAYSCGGRNNHAGGTGTYADPLTFAARVGSSYAQCEIIYSPYLKKYLRLEDSCAACTGDWTDVWTGTVADGGQAQINCENSLTPDAQQSVIRQPATNLEVDTTKLWTGSTCNTAHVYASNTPSSYCGGGGSTPPSSGCQTGCSWAGHCIGCACTTFDDCSDDYVCTNGLCASS
ncbi:hypothetical protein GGR57DRAFT_476269 [Xylariaceae sp. FL1272]|nr:hypothetical protein GGR57DRAFT_476269 [Xylariaceae sp. FL1272]